MTVDERTAMPPLIYGTAWKKERTAALVELALAQGFVGIDTACQPKHYDEAGVGVGVQASAARGLRRRALYLQTKFTPLSGQDPARVPYDPKAGIETQVQQSCVASLENLGTSYLDCLLLHSPLSSLKATLRAWRVFEELVIKGIVSTIGISNCYSSEFLCALFDATTIKPSVVQNRFYEKTNYDRDIRSICKERNICYQRFWTLTANPRVLAHESLGAIASRHGMTNEQLFFRCLIHRGIVPLTGTCSVEHMRQDLAILRIDLDEDEVAAVMRLL